jgi:hypothetical protein
MKVIEPRYGGSNEFVSAASKPANDTIFCRGTSHLEAEDFWSLGDPIVLIPCALKDMSMRACLWWKDLNSALIIILKQFACWIGLAWPSGLLILGDWKSTSDLRKHWYRCPPLRGNGNPLLRSEILIGRICVHISIVKIIRFLPRQIHLCKRSRIPSQPISASAKPSKYSPDQLTRCTESSHPSPLDRLPGVRRDLRIHPRLHRLTLLTYPTVQSHWSEAMAAFRASKCSGIKYIDAMSADKRTVLEMAKTALKKDLAGTVEQPKTYLSDLRSALHQG